jgi:hypothetical protein
MGRVGPVAPKLAQKHTLTLRGIEGQLNISADLAGGGGLQLAVSCYEACTACTMTHCLVG